MQALMTYIAVVPARQALRNCLNGAAKPLAWLLELAQDMHQVRRDAVSRLR